MPDGGCYTALKSTYASIGIAVSFFADTIHAGNVCEAVILC